MFNECLEIRWKTAHFCILTCNTALYNHFVWEVISSIRHSVSSPDETPRSSSKILRCTSYFQLSSNCFIWWWNTASYAWYTASSFIIIGPFSLYWFELCKVANVDCNNKNNLMKTVFLRFQAEASGLSQSHDPDRLSVLPLWISIQTVGKLIELGSSSNHDNEDKDNFKKQLIAFMSKHASCFLVHFCDFH